MDLFLTRIGCEANAVRHLLPIAALFFLAGTPVWSADKDSPLVAQARKKLQTPVTVDYKETRLAEVVEDLKKQVENLSIWLDTAGGVSRNLTFTYQATDKPLAVVLDGLFQKSDLGYVIGKKKDGRYEGWIVIKKGKFRGDEEAAASAPAESAKKANPAPEKKATQDKPEDTPEQREYDAARKLKLAKMLEKDGVADKAKARYREIVDKYPGTKAAKEARALLEKMDQ
jgi:hypothetical protein